MAMPPPMVPAPMMPTDCTGRGTVPSGRSLILAACRSAKKIWRCAADCVPVISPMNSSRSRFMPSSNGRVHAASMHWMFASGAWKPRKRRAFFALLQNEIADATLVPQAALASRGGKEVVFVLAADAATVRQVPVRTGLREDGWVQVDGEGLSGRVVILGQQNLKDGSRVAVPQAKGAAP